MKKCNSFLNILVP